MGPRKFRIPGVEPVHDDVDAAVEDPTEGVMATRGPSHLNPSV